MNSKLYLPRDRHDAILHIGDRVLWNGETLTIYHLADQGNGIGYVVCFDEVDDTTWADDVEFLSRPPL